eukprot:1394945-Amorphochlora_amoeboformis.AAC.2
MSHIEGRTSGHITLNLPLREDTLGHITAVMSYLRLCHMITSKIIRDISPYHNFEFRSIWGGGKTIRPVVDSGLCQELLGIGLGGTERVGKGNGVIFPSRKKKNSRNFQNRVRFQDWRPSTNTHLKRMASGANLPPQWLGLLQWSLKHNDGTRDSKTTRPMAEDDQNAGRYYGSKAPGRGKGREGVACLPVYIHPPPGSRVLKQSDRSKEGGGSGVVEGKEDVIRSVSWGEDIYSKIHGCQRSYAHAHSYMKSTCVYLCTHVNYNLDYSELEALEEEEAKKPEGVTKKEQTLEVRERRVDGEREGEGER